MPAGYGLKVTYTAIHKHTDTVYTHTYTHPLSFTVALKYGSGEFECHSPGGAKAPGPQLCVSESDLVPCHTEGSLGARGLP